MTTVTTTNESLYRSSATTMNVMATTIMTNALSKESAVAVILRSISGPNALKDVQRVATIVIRLITAMSFGQLKTENQSRKGRISIITPKPHALEF